MAGRKGLSMRERYLRLLRRDPATDVDDEIAFHLEMRRRELEGRGEDPGRAQELALRRFGDLAAVRADCVEIAERKERRMKRAERLHDLRQDVAFALRTLARSPMFTAVALLTLALGIGANTATFTLVDALLLKPLPVEHPDRLVMVGDPRRTGSLSEGSPRTDLASYPVYTDIRDRARTVSGLYATGRTGRLDVLVGGGGRDGAAGEAEHPRGRLVSGNYFSVLGVRARLGRLFDATDDRVAGGGPVVVISSSYWQRRFAGARSAVGRSISINGAPFTIVGIAPPGFSGDLVGQPIDVWIPLTMQPTLMPHRPFLDDRATSWLLLMGRLAPGATLAGARTELSALYARSLLDHATAAQLGTVRQRLEDEPVAVASGARGFSYYRSVYGRPLLTLMVAVGLVLLVVCANLASLLLARAAGRGSELSVRVALGAGWLRLAQQLLTESLVLAALGGALGLLGAAWGSSALLRLASGGPEPIPLEAHLDGRVLLFTAGLALLTTVLAGLAPALRAARVAPAAVLRAGGRGMTATTRAPGRLPLGRVLVVAQIALSTLLLVGTGMLVRSTQRLESVELGLARDHLLVARIDAARSGYGAARLDALVRDLTARVERLPGVAAAVISENGLLSGTESGTSLQVEGFEARVDADTNVAYDDVGPGYFHAIGAHVLRGRDFEASDDATGAKVAIVNRSMARFYFPDADPIGRRVSIDGVDYRIVGVVADVQEQSPRKAPDRRLYLPAAQLPTGVPGQFYLNIRTVGDPARLATPVRRALQAADPALTVLEVDPLPSLVRESISQDRLVARVVAFFGALALLLAALGLYGVIAYGTLRRTGEFGLRMALGARPAAVTRMVLREALLLTGAGVVVGVPVALAGVRLLRSQLFGIGVLDVPSLVLTVAILGASAAAAGYLPARRAARVAPLDALRTQA